METSSRWGSFFGASRERAQDEAVDFDGDVPKGCSITARFGVFFGFGIEKSDRAFGRDGQCARDHFIKDASQSVDVRAFVDLPRGDLLGGHVFGRTKQGERRKILIGIGAFVSFFGDAEVEQFQRSIFA